MSASGVASSYRSPKVARAQRYATVLALIATLGPFFYGFEGMVLNGAIKAVKESFQLGPIAQGVAGAAGVIGGLIGAICAGRISDHIGRRGVMMWVGPFLMFEAIFGAFSPYIGFWFLLLCRLMGGIGFGAATTVAPGYVAEISPAKIRGRLIAIRQLAIILGLFFAALINAGVTAAYGKTTAVAALGLHVWQWMFVCLLIPGIFYVVLTALIPESPRYLVSKHQDQKAASILERVTGEEGEQLQRRIADIKYTLGAEGTSKMNIIAVLGSKWKGLVWVGVAIAAFQQLTGINGVFFFSNKLFESVGFTESQALLETLLLTFFKIVGVACGILLVDKVGRKRMLIWGGTLIFVALGIVAFVFSIGEKIAEPLPKFMGKMKKPEFAAFCAANNAKCHHVIDLTNSPVLAFIAVAALCLFILGFTSSWGPIFSIVMGEMFPNQIRGSAMSIASGGDFLFNLLVVFLFPYMIEWSPAGTYWIYCIFGILAVIFTVKYLHETNGKELEEMG